MWYRSSVTGHLHPIPTIPTQPAPQKYWHKHTLITPEHTSTQVDDHADELTVVHAKQESKMEVDGASVYIFVPHRVQSGEDRGPGLPLNSTVGLNNSTVGSNNSTVGSNYVPKVRLNKFNDGSWIKQ